jgi:hypothetical protein
MQFLHKLQELLNPAFPKKRIENGLNHFPPPFPGKAGKMPRQGQEIWGIPQFSGRKTPGRKTLPEQDSGLTRMVVSAGKTPRFFSSSRCQLGPESIFFTPWLIISSLV